MNVKLRKIFFHPGLVSVLLLFVVALSSCRFLPQRGGEQEREQPPRIVQEQSERKIVFEEPTIPEPREIFPSGKKEIPGPGPAAKDRLPRVAIIIDDMGYHQQIGRRLLALNLNLTFSFLPEAPFTLEQENQAWQQGRDVMLHMPMEAGDAVWDPGPGALYLKFSPEKMRAMVEKDLAAVPHAIGSNNHMGSKFTEDRAAMHEVLGVLKRRGLFFIDSYTTAASTGLDEARKMSVPTARRHVFLDNIQDREKICRQLDQLVILAKKKGWAIGIGHPHQATLSALSSCGKQLGNSVEVVSVHTLVR
jgi:polysaccharide deacetylase 2 family uncharacterized protein YibQ